MTADLAANIDALMGAREWWSDLSDKVGYAVAVFVLMESVAGLKLFENRVGEGVAKGIAAFGWIGLVVALVAEGKINGEIAMRTTKIELALNFQIRETLIANATLRQKINKERDDLTAVQTETGLQKTDLQTARTNISGLTTDENTLRTNLKSDEKSMHEHFKMIGMRYLEKWQYDVLAHLKGKITKVYIASQKDCRECQEFADQIQQPLILNGIDAPRISASFEAIGASGVSLRTPTPSEKDPLEAALRKLKILGGVMGVDPSKEIPMDAPTIGVGEKNDWWEAEPYWSPYIQRMTHHKKWRAKKP